MWFCAAAQTPVSEGQHCPQYSFAACLNRKCSKPQTVVAPNPPSHQGIFPRSSPKSLIVNVKMSASPPNVEWCRTSRFAIPLRPAHQDEFVHGGQRRAVPRMGRLSPESAQFARPMFRVRPRTISRTTVGRRQTSIHCTE